MEIQSDTQLRPKTDRSYGWVWTILMLGFVAALSYFFYTSVIKNPCDIPISYSIGNIDPRFNISESEVRKTVDDAAARWNKGANEVVYKYDPDARLKINLVYDERQKNLDEIKARIAEFDSDSKTIEEFRDKIESLSAAYEADLNAYNQKVAYWNSQGGAPPEAFNQLNTERVALEKRRVEINKMAAILNAQISENNSNIADFNDQLESESNKIVTSGEYFTDGSRINIYTYGDTEELRLVLMHELGHAMSYRHDSEPTSIMYPVLQEQNMDDPLPSDEDMELVGSICNIGEQPLDWDVLLYRIRMKFSRLSTLQ